MVIVLGHGALALHGDLEQHERDEVLIQFSNRSATVLVATDVAARGLDIKEMPVVINYDVANDAQTHLHRIGRTARAGSKGHAFTLCVPSESARVIAIEVEQNAPLQWIDAPAANADTKPAKAQMRTLIIDGGRQQKLRPGDLLGALTGDAGLPAHAIGKIDIQARRAYVAISTSAFAQAMGALRNGKIKGRKFRVRTL